MNEWREYILEEIAKVIDCEHKTAPLVEDSSFYSVRTSNISKGKIDYESCNRVSRDVYDEWTVRAVPKEGDIILAREAPIGEVGIIKKGYKVCLGQRTVLISVSSSDVNNKFLLYYLVNPTQKNSLIEMSAGSVVSHLNMKDIRAFVIKIPPLLEQKAIASVLSSLDDKIDLLHRQNKTLEQMAEALFRQWFVESVRSGESKGGEAKEVWDWKQLGEFIEVVRGLSYKGVGLSDSENGIPMHNLNSVFEGGGYKYDGIKFYSGEYKKQHNVSPGDLIVTNTEQGHEMRLIGFPAIIPKYYGDTGIFSQHIYKLQLKENYLSIPFLYYLLMTFDMREQIAGSTNGSTVNMLPKDGIEWARFRIPPKSKIDYFTEIVQPMLDKQEMNFESIKTLENLRDTLLPKLMNGEVRMEDVNITDFHRLNDTRDG